MSKKPIIFAEILSQRLRNGLAGAVTKKFTLTATAAKNLRRSPVAVVDKLANRMITVERNSLDEIRKIPGYHDKLLPYDYPGARSIRLSIRELAIYRIEADQIEIIDVGKDVYDH